MDTANLLEKIRLLDTDLDEINIAPLSIAPLSIFKPIKTEPITPCKEVEVVRNVVVGKYYESTYCTRKTGLWPKEKYYSTKPREYVGQYIRHKQQGMGDGADHWYVFLRNNEEIQVELDYEGTRSFYEVPPRKE
jgi:hypothetical protein